MPKNRKADKGRPARQGLRSLGALSQLAITPGVAGVAGVAGASSPQDIGEGSAQSKRKASELSTSHDHPIEEDNQPTQHSEDSKKAVPGRTPVQTNKLLRPFGKLVDKTIQSYDNLPEDVQSVWHSTIDLDGVKSDLRRVAQGYVHTPVNPQASSGPIQFPPLDSSQQPSFEAFEKICNYIGDSDGPCQPERIKNAWEIVKDLDIVSCLEKFCRMMWYLQDEALEQWQKLVHLGGSSDPHYRLNYLQYHYTTHEDPKRLEEIHGCMQYFRRAFDGVSANEIFEALTGKVRDLIPSAQRENYDPLVRTINREYNKETGRKGVIQEGWDWARLLNPGVVWKTWCEAFSSRQSSLDRGILLLLMVVGQRHNFPRPEDNDNWHPIGSSAIGKQPFWVAEYIKVYYPTFMKMAQALDDWAVNFYVDARVEEGPRRTIENELRAIVMGEPRMGTSVADSDDTDHMSENATDTLHVLAEDEGNSQTSQMLAEDLGTLGTESNVEGAALQVMDLDATPSDMSQNPKFLQFEQMCRKIGTGGEVLDPERIKRLYPMIENLDMDSYIETLREMTMFLWVEGSQREQRGEFGIAQCNISDTKVANQLFYYMQGYETKSNEDIFEIHRHLDCFREAFDGVAMCEYIEEKTRQPLEKFLNSKGDIPWGMLKVLNTEREREHRKGLILEGWNWTEVIRRSTVWSNWCKAFSSKNRSSDRGILLLLIAIMKPVDFPTQYLTQSVYVPWYLSGGDASKCDISWIAGYIKEYMPEFMKMSEALDKWAVLVYKKAYLSPADRRKMEKELRAAVYGLEN